MNEHRRARRSTRRWSTAVTAASLAFALFCASPAMGATAGDSDTDFDQDGFVRTDVFGRAKDMLADVAIQPDGKIVAVGTWGTASTRSNFALVRYNRDGSVDTSFGSGGRTLTDFDGDDDVANAVALQGDGKIVVVGSARIGGTNPDFAIARYNPDGSRDASFSGDGKVTTNWGSTDVANDVAIQSDGRIVVVGERTADVDFLVARYTRTGGIDTTFNGGHVVTGWGDRERATAVAIHRDGRIVVAGTKSSSRYSDFALARYTADGVLDPSFDQDGLKSGERGGTWDIAYDVAIDSVDRIVVAGKFGPEMGFMRHYSTGKLDPSFDRDGIARVNYSVNGNLTNQYATGIALQGDGKIVAVGSVNQGGGWDMAIVRLRTDGRPDPSFAADGTHYAGWGNSDFGTAVRIQTNGRIVAAAYTNSTGDEDFALARFHATTD